MSEKQKPAIELHEDISDNKDLLALSEQQNEILRDKLDHAEKAHKERLGSESEATAQAKELARDSKEDPVKNNEETLAGRRRGVIPKAQLANAYDIQMKHARERMDPAARVFSKFIHARPIEAASDAIGSTIARPNALLCGSIAAFLAVTILYFLAKHYGFQLSGFETIVAFITGWILGILYDYFSIMFRRHDN